MIILPLYYRSSFFLFSFYLLGDNALFCNEHSGLPPQRNLYGQNHYLASLHCSPARADDQGGLLQFVRKFHG